MNNDLLYKSMKSLGVECLTDTNDMIGLVLVNQMFSSESDTLYQVFVSKEFPHGEKYLIITGIEFGSWSIFPSDRIHIDFCEKLGLITPSEYNDLLKEYRELNRVNQKEIQLQTIKRQINDLNLKPEDLFDEQ